MKKILLLFVFILLGGGLQSCEDNTEAEQARLYVYATGIQGKEYLLAVDKYITRPTTGYNPTQGLYVGKCIEITEDIMEQEYVGDEVIFITRFGGEFYINLIDPETGKKTHLLDFTMKNGYTYWINISELF